MKYVFIITFIVVMLFILRQNKKVVGMYSGIIFSGTLYYGIVPLLIQIFGNEMNISSIYFVYKGTYDYIFSYLSLIIFFVVFYISSKLDVVKRDYIIIADKNKSVKYLNKFGIFCLLIGGVSLLGFFAALGGISSALQIAEKARSFSTSLDDFMPYYASLLVVPARLVTVAPYCFWSLLYLQEDKKEKTRVYLIISYVLTVMFYLFNAGRAQIIMLILCIIIPIFFNRGITHPWRCIIIIGCLSLSLLDVMDALFVYMQTGEFVLKETNYLDYLKQFAYPINNVFHAFNIGNIFGYRLGKDYFTVFLDLVPGLSFEPSYVVTSQYFSGEKWRILGGTPNDLVTISILEFHVLGLIIVPFVLGKIAKFVDEFVCGYGDIRVKRVLSTVLAVNSYLLVSSADPIAVFRGFIMWMLPLIFVLSKYKQKRGII